MRTHSELYRNGIDPRPGPQSYPPTVEGIPTDTLGNYVAIPYADFSVYAALKALGLEENPLNGKAIYGGGRCWVVMAVPFAMWLRLSRKMAPERLLAGLAAWLFIADLFLPGVPGQL